MEKQKLFKRIVARLRKKPMPERRYCVTIVDNVTGERIVDENTNAVLGVILRGHGPEYIVNMRTDIVNVTSMVMQVEELADHMRKFESRIGECERDILDRAKGNHEIGGNRRETCEAPDQGAEDRHQ